MPETCLWGKVVYVIFVCCSCFTVSRESLWYRCTLRTSPCRGGSVCSLGLSLLRYVPGHVQKRGLSLMLCYSVVWSCPVVSPQSNCGMHGIYQQSLLSCLQCIVHSDSAQQQCRTGQQTVSCLWCVVLCNSTEQRCKIGHSNTVVLFVCYVPYCLILQSSNVSGKRRQLGTNSAGMSVMLCSDSTELQCQTGHLPANTAVMSVMWCVV